MKSLPQFEYLAITSAVQMLGQHCGFKPQISVNNTSGLPGLITYAYQFVLTLPFFTVNANRVVYALLIFPCCALTKWKLK